MISNIIFDYGNVLAYPKTGNWFITPNTKKIIGFQNAEAVGFFPILMDRKRKKKVSKYAIANNIEDVICIIEKYNSV